MIRVALTGGIGTGKSTTLALFERLGVPCLNADAVVHQLLARGGAAYAAVATQFPSTQTPEGICRKTLGDLVFADASALHKLESILHPLVVQAEAAFLHSVQAPLAVVEIPLLFETGSQSRFDVIVVTTASPMTKWWRVKGRPHMTEAKFRAIVARQWPEAKKLAHADFVVHTGLGKAAALRQVKQIVSTLHA